MMRIAPEIGDVSIVLLGNFNPVIFQPSWFEKMGLIPEELTASAEIELIHPEVVSFQSDWLKIKVERGRFAVTTMEAPWIRLRDLTVRTFKEFLSHTPVSKMGINRQVHFKVKNEEVRDKIGRQLAPQEPWGEWAPYISQKNEKGPQHGGLTSLTMEQRVRDDGYKGLIRSRIEPSTKISMATGIYMEINDHYEVENFEDVMGCDEIISILETNFEKSIARSEWIIDQIMALSEAV